MNLDQRNTDTLIELNDIINLCRKMQKKIMADGYKTPNALERKLLKEVELKLKKALDA